MSYRAKSSNSLGSTPPRIDSDCNLDAILKENFTTDFRKGYITMKGVCLPEHHEKFARAIEEFDVRDDDVWVCSFPKTGTTWTQEMTWCIANDLDFEGAKAPLIGRFPFLEYSSLFDYSAIIPRMTDADVCELLMDSVSYVRDLAAPRFIKTHLPFHLLPRQLRTGEKRARIIYVARNPKDTCVSYFHHCRLMEGYKGDFNDFCKLFLAGKLCFAPFWSHVLGFREKSNNDNLLLLKYEDMKTDLTAVIKKTAVFLGKTDMTDDQIALLAEHLSFANMRNNPAVNYTETVQFNKRLKLIDVEGEFMRCGKVMQWKSDMSQDTIDLFDQLFKGKLAF